MFKVKKCRQPHHSAYNPTYLFFMLSISNQTIHQSSQKKVTIKEEIQSVSTTLKAPQTSIEIPKVQTYKQGPWQEKQRNQISDYGLTTQVICQTWEQVSFMGKNLWVLQMETEIISYMEQKERDSRDFWPMYA